MMRNTRQTPPRSAAPEPDAELGRRWRAGRAPIEIAHLDAAAAARPSQATIQAQVDHLMAETTLGGYVAEERVAERLTGARAALAGLLDPDLSAADVTFHHSGTTAFAAVLAAWPLPAGGRVGVVPSEYGSNLIALRARAARDGLTLVDLPTGADGLIDLDRLDRGDPVALDRLDLVTFPHVPSHRGIAQPAAAVAARCRAAGVPLLLDVAQSLGQVDVTTAGAAAYVGTARKWLCGPRGVGFLAVRADVVERLGAPEPSLYAARWEDGPRDAGDRPGPANRTGAPDQLATAAGGTAVGAGTAGRTAAGSGTIGGGAVGAGRLVPGGGVGRFGLGEVPVAAQVGLAAALEEYLDAGPARIRARIHALARGARAALDGVGGWRVGEDVASPVGIVTLRPPPGVEVAGLRTRLYREAGVLSTELGPIRARDAVPALRISPHVYTTQADLVRLADALAALTGR
jgi:pyridoxal 5-phosphate dependent beta-lyase